MFDGSFLVFCPPSFTLRNYRAISGVDVDVITKIYAQAPDGC